MKVGGQNAMTPNERLEIEIKLRIAGPTALRKRLKGLRARMLRRVHERNTLYEAADGRLGRSGNLLRLRQTEPVARGARLGELRRQRGKGRQGFLTFKGGMEGGAYKVRRELECGVKEPEIAGRILEALGYRPWFRYEKYRSTYRLRGLPSLSVEFDETPAGDYLELEGPPAAIDKAARLLGYGPKDYLTTSYYEIFLQERDRRGLAPDAMLFTAKK